MGYALEIGALAIMYIMSNMEMYPIFIYLFIYLFFLLIIQERQVIIKN
jgi:hypothetical protein